MQPIRKNIYQWYAIYTRSRSEKSVNLELSLTGIESYLPLKKTIRKWSDRKKMVEVPIPEPQINAIRAYLDETEPIPLDDQLKMEAGKSVLITSGPMIGMTGILLDI